MMLRLNRADNPKRILITIEGELKGESVKIAESACREALARNVQVTVFIKNVMEIDEEGHTFLKRMATANAHIRATGIYSRYVVRNVLLNRSD